MNMNWLHRRYCASAAWAAHVEQAVLPAVLDGIDLGPDVLELGPGPGVTTRLLAKRTRRLTALEIDEKLAERLRGRLPGREVRAQVRIVRGDATQMAFADASFSGAVCLTMLHHVPSPQLQDRLFAETRRVLRPGGVFAGCDSRPDIPLRLIHLFDTMVPVAPATLPRRLSAAGFTDVRVSDSKRRLVFSARAM
jgi:ubiquinone/menaquinone biosynthesis C-methylase UbiE